VWLIWLSKASDVVSRPTHPLIPLGRSLRAARFFFRRNTPMWQHIISGAITLILESYMQAIEWVYIG
jgi:hypothetical protein